MKLKELLAVIDVKTNLDFEVGKISLDSREVKDNYLYICFNPSYLNKALLKKNIMVISNFKYNHKKIIYIENLDIIYDKIIHHFFGYVADKVKIIGVTGTNGKTTIAHSLFTLFNSLGYPSLYIGTLGAFYSKKEILLKNTTPSLIENLSIIQEAQREGIQYVFIEVSSHALVQNRVKGINFEGAIFTNLTQDHLDYHQDMNSYALAKKALFDNLDSNSFAIINKDDSYSQIMINDCKAKCVFYGLDKSVTKLKYHQGINFKLNKEKIKSSFIGKFNVYNLLAIYYAAKELKLDLEKVRKEIEKLPNVNGRMDVIKYNSNTVIVDFAHSPDAVKKVLEEVKNMKYKKLKVLFGCGGNRDKTKRPIMGSIVEEYADEIYLTNDNIRNENQEDIALDIERGIKDKSKVIKEYNREKAIQLALASLTKKEILVILGRGHETYLTVKDKKIPLNDKDVVTSWIHTH